LVKLTDAMCSRPGGTLPQKFRNPADLQAMYRLMRTEEVTHQALLASHRRAVLKEIGGLAPNAPVLIIHDSTELDYTTHKSLADLGPIGNGSRRGFIAHNSLAVHPETRQAIGLVNQVLHRRPKKPRGHQSTAQRRKIASRESHLWVTGTEPLPGDRRFIDVCDRGADTFEFLHHEIKSGRRFVIRSCNDRCILVGHQGSTKGKLHSHAATLPISGTWNLKVTANVTVKSPKGKGPKTIVRREEREAKVAVAFAPVRICPPRIAGNYERKPLFVWVVRVWELDPPAGQERLEWFLITNEPVRTFEDAYRVVSWYECRWVVEEFHKGMKTGCRVECPQFTRESRLQPAIALLSIVALSLLQLRDASRAPDADTRPAVEVVDPIYVKVLSLWRHKKVRIDWTVREYFLALARLGGHLNRKNDHPPGWQVLWEGWKELLPMVVGYTAAKPRFDKSG
jgi:hypothetical protein